MNNNDELIICEQAQYTLDDFKDWHLNWNNWLQQPKIDNQNNINEIQEDKEVNEVKEDKEDKEVNEVNEVKEDKELQLSK